jgi:2,5-diamino-6-(ribosylamino)-4(3H)-pyrimidinone 5'-phosphate reductase
VPDSRGRIRTWHHWLQLPYWKGAVVLVCRTTPKEYLEYLNRRHIDAIVAGDGHVDYRTALEELNDRYDVKVVRVDSGGTLNGHLLRAGLVDEVSLLVHPALVGGVSPRSAFRAPDLTGPDGVTPLKLLAVEEVRDGIVWLRYEVVR